MKKLNVKALIKALGVMMFILLILVGIPIIEETSKTAFMIVVFAIIAAAIALCLYALYDVFSVMENDKNNNKKICNETDRSQD